MKLDFIVKRDIEPGWVLTGQKEDLVRELIVREDRTSNEDSLSVTYLSSDSDRIIGPWMKKPIYRNQKPSVTAYEDVIMKRCIQDFSPHALPCLQIFGLAYTGYFPVLVTATEWRIKPSL